MSNTRDTMSGRNISRMANQSSFDGNWDKIMNMWTGGYRTVNLEIKKSRSIYNAIKQEQLDYVISIIGKKWPLHYYVVNMVICANDDIDETFPNWKNNLTNDELYRLNMLIERACVGYCEDVFFPRKKKR